MFYSVLFMGLSIYKKKKQTKKEREKTLEQGSGAHYILSFCYSLHLAYEAHWYHRLKAR